MSVLWSVISFLAALLPLVFVHELGHYLAARFCGVKILRFSIGFGKPVWRLRVGKDATEWVISALPFGGYVKMLDEREGSVPEDCLHRAFNRQSVGKRILIVVAGPLANLVLAFVLYWAIFLNGIPGLVPTVGEPRPGSVAAAAGFRAGDVVRSVNGKDVSTWQDFRWEMLQVGLSRKTVSVDVMRDRTVRSLHFDASTQATDPGETDILDYLGFHHRRGDIPAVVEAVSPGSAAVKAGILRGDEIQAVDGQPVSSWMRLVEKVREAPGRELALRLRGPDGDTRIARVTPDAVKQKDGKIIGRIGVSPRVPEAQGAAYVVHRDLGVLEAFHRALIRTVDMSMFSLKMLGKMMVGELSLRNLSGPVTIADYAGQAAQSGFISFLSFLALISISLGVLNLLPIPMLDGGHLMYYFAEIVMGKPLPDRLMELGQQAGMVILVFMMGLALINDLNRLIGS